MNKTFSSKSNAKRAALAALGTDKVEAEDYKVTLGADGRWRWAALTKAAGEPESAKSARGTTTAADAEARVDGPGSRPSRADSKQARLIAMLQTTHGATVAEIAAAFGWQPHTVRGAIAGALKKRLGLAVTSAKVEGRGRAYRIAS